MSGITDKAEQLLEERMSSIRDLEKYAGAVEQARSDLQAAEQSLSKAWTAATRAGWSEDELKRLGVAKPAVRRGRPKGTTKGSKSTGPGEHSGTASDTPPQSTVPTRDADTPTTAE